MFFEQWREAKKFAYDSVSEIGAEESFLFVYQKDVMLQRMQEHEYLVTCTDALDLFDDMSGRKGINAPVRKRAEFIVLCNKNRPYACSCQYYSRMGIPCAHMLSLFMADDDKRLEMGGYNDPTPMFAASDGTDGAVARRWHSGWISQNETIATLQDRKRLGITTSSDKNTNADAMTYFQQIPAEQRYGALTKEFQRLVGDGLARGQYPDLVQCLHDAQNRMKTTRLNADRKSLTSSTRSRSVDKSLADDTQMPPPPPSAPLSSNSAHAVPSTIIQMPISTPIHGQRGKSKRKVSIPDRAECHRKLLRVPENGKIANHFLALSDAYEKLGDTGRAKWGRDAFVTIRKLPERLLSIDQVSGEKKLKGFGEKSIAELDEFLKNDKQGTKRRTELENQLESARAAPSSA